MDQPPEEQMNLLPVDELPAEVFRGETAEEARERVYTGERLQAQDPKKYATIATCYYVLGMSMRKICDALGCHHETVRAVVRREYGSRSVASLKQAAAGQYRWLSQLIRDRAEEVLADPELFKKIPFDKLAVSGAVFEDKAQLLSGGPTSRSELTRPADGEDFGQFLDRIRRTGFGGVPPEQKGIEPAGAAGQIEGPAGAGGAEPGPAEIQDGEDQGGGRDPDVAGGG